MQEFPELEGDIKTDVLIIGGGMAGLLCAYHLKDAGISYVLVEEKRICGGVTENTTAKITAQHGEIYHKLLKKKGAENAYLYYRANEMAMEKYKKLASKIECNFEISDNYVYRTDDEVKLQKEFLAMEQLGIPVQWTQMTQLPFPVVGAICMPNQAKFHPLKFAEAIAKELNIYENTPVLYYDGKLYCTPKGKIMAKKTVVATHFPIWNKHGLYPIKMYQERSYVLALKNTQALNGMYVDGNKNGLSFRQSGELLLLGGGNHRTGKPGEGWPEEEAKKYYPESKPQYRWATQDCITLDGIPYIGQYSATTPDLYVATGFNKWGMTGAMVAAQLLTDLIMQRKNPFEKVFSPERSILHPQLVVNAAESVINIIKPTTPRCPHLGCALVWNRRERTWDCPCHGSRFSEDGTKLNNPATGDLRGKER